MFPVATITHEAMLAHDNGPGHPERPERLMAVIAALRREPAVDLTWTEPAPAPREAVARVHDPDYIDRIDSLRGRHAQLDPDTMVSPATVQAAYLAAGAAVLAVDTVIQGPIRRAFAIVRPPGHHAERAKAMGFCVFNNVAVAAAHALSHHHLRRILIVDWDVHHGNGTQHIFESRSEVLFFSVHEWPNYPGTGRRDETGIGPGRGHTINVPLTAGSTDADYARAFDEILLPAADRFKPDLVLVSAGFDAHDGDPLGGMRLTAPGFAALTRRVRSIADTHARSRLALFLEGGYDIHDLAGCVVACTKALAED